ncbi:cytochrome P450, partial [Arthrobacter deserti]|nr:cytochrome P450 [Arthrobacter deserti]
MAEPTLWEQILDYSHRADPYPLYAGLRSTPVSRQADGSYLVSTYPETVALLHDPRLSSDPSHNPQLAEA